MNVFDMPIIGNDQMVEQIQCYPKTKKKRIVNKWKKRKFKYRPRKDALIFSFGIICHPSMIEKVEMGIKVAKGDKNEDSLSG